MHCVPAQHTPNDTSDKFDSTTDAVAKPTRRDSPKSIEPNNESTSSSSSDSENDVNIRKIPRTFSTSSASSQTDGNLKIFPLQKPIDNTKLVSNVVDNPKTSSAEEDNKINSSKISTETPSPKLLSRNSSSSSSSSSGSDSEGDPEDRKHHSSSCSTDSIKDYTDSGTLESKEQYSPVFKVDVNVEIDTNTDPDVITTITLPPTEVLTPQVQSTTTDFETDHQSPSVSKDIAEQILDNGNVRNDSPSPIKHETQLPGSKQGSSSSSDEDNLNDGFLKPTHSTTSSDSESSNALTLNKEVSKHKDSSSEPDEKVDSLDTDGKEKKKDTSSSSESDTVEKSCNEVRHPTEQKEDFGQPSNQLLNIKTSFQPIEDQTLDLHKETTPLDEIKHKIESTKITKDLTPSQRKGKKPITKHIKESTTDSSSDSDKDKSIKIGKEKKIKNTSSSSSDEETKRPAVVPISIDGIVANTIQSAVQIVSEKDKSNSDQDNKKVSPKPRAPRPKKRKTKRRSRNNSSVSGSASEQEKPTDITKEDPQVDYNNIHTCILTEPCKLEDGNILHPSDLTTRRKSSSSSVDSISNKSKVKKTKSPSSSSSDSETKVVHTDSFEHQQKPDGVINIDLTKPKHYITKHPVPSLESIDKELKKPDIESILRDGSVKESSVDDDIDKLETDVPCTKSLLKRSSSTSSSDHPIEKEEHLDQVISTPLEDTIPDNNDIVPELRRKSSSSSSSSSSSTSNSSSKDGGRTVDIQIIETVRLPVEDTIIVTEEPSVQQEVLLFQSE